MKYIYLFLVSIICTCSVRGAQFKYKFNAIPLSEAIVAIAEQHPDIQINFIYDELDFYKTSATIDTDDAYDALRMTIGLNPVSISNIGNRYYIEARQHGRYAYSGNVLCDGSDSEPIAGASVVLLTPKDSTVITYGITDGKGHFSIPCDKRNVLMKLSCIGYVCKYIDLPDFAVGTVTMRQIPVSLRQVTVEAAQTEYRTDKNVYIPTSRQKNASQDAADLLRRMAIPQLVINPADNSVKDVFGNSVAVYINYHEAQADELKGMKMTDVRKVEYTEFPTDPRFKGEPRIVNFIVQEYEYGGYTKAYESFRTLNGIFNDSEIFSRFTYKKLTYDIYAGSDNQNYHHDGSDNSACYFLGNDDQQTTIIRDEIFNKSHTVNNTYPITVRTVYASPRFTARNALSFTHFSSPTNNTDGELHVDLYPDKDYAYARNTPNRYNTVYYHSNYWGLIGSNISLDITPSFKHTHRNNISAYESTLIQKPVYNTITENVYNWGLQASGRIVWRNKNQLSLFLAGGQNINNLVYQGTNNLNDSYSNSFMVGNLNHRYRTKKITISSLAGLGFEHNSMNGITTKDVYPMFGINTWISFSKTSQISASLNYRTTTPDINMKVNDIVQSNEYLYLTANPHLKNWRNLTSNLSYNKFFSNSFSIAAFAGYEQDFNRVATIYKLYDDGNALLRDYINDGSYIRYYAGISANYKLFDNSLQLYANLTQNAYEITGSYKDSYYPFRIQLQGVYYWKSFNILASWGNPQNILTENSNYIIRRRNFHMFSVGWGNGIWTVNLAAKNIFNKGWKSETWEKHSPLYSEYRQVYTPSSHPSLNLSVTYTVGYGKKIQRGNEVRGQDAAPSAIIK